MGPSRLRMSVKTGLSWRRPGEGYQVACQGATRTRQERPSLLLPTEQLPHSSEPSAGRQSHEPDLSHHETHHARPSSRSHRRLGGTFILPDPQVNIVLLVAYSRPGPHGYVHTCRHETVHLPHLPTRAPAGISYSGAATLHHVRQTAPLIEQRGLPEIVASERFQAPPFPAAGTRRQVR